MSSRKLPTFFSNKFRIFYLISLIFLEFSFLQSDKCGPMIHFHSPIFRYPVWIAPFVEGAVFVVVVALFLSKSSIHQCVTSSIFSHCFHWFSLVLFFLNIMLLFYYYVSVRQLEIWDGNNTSIFFILQSYCSFQDFFFTVVSPIYSWRFSLQILWWILFEILWGCALNLQIVVHSMDIMVVFTI